MLIKNNAGLDCAPAPIESSPDNHPVIRTLYDHADEVTCLDFHPFDPILVSGSRDYTIKFFEYAKPTTKKSFRCINEVEQIRCLHFHPSGDWLAVGTQHPVVRLYDVETGRCFVSTHSQDQHNGAITSVRWAPNGRLFATSSKDGSFKLWDGVTNRCVNTFERKHDGEEVCSVMFSKNSKYLLTSGKDSQVRLWELSTAVSSAIESSSFRR
jgi:cleavage stimulation factor subunit 1